MNRSKKSSKKSSNKTFNSKKSVEHQPRESHPRRVKDQNISYSDIEGNMSDSESIADVRVEPTISSSSVTAAVDPRVTALLQIMIEDRKQDREAQKKEQEERRKDREAREKREQEERQKDREAQQQLFKSLLESKTKEMTEASNTRKEEDRIERALSCLPRMREGDDLEELVSLVETKLRMDNVPEVRWKGALLECLSPKSMALAQDVLDIDDSTFWDVKRRLLDCSGLTTPIAEELLFNLSNPTFSGSDIASPLRKLCRWVKKAIEGAVTVGEIIEKIVIHRTKAEMSERGKAYIDNRNPQTVEEMRSTLAQYVASHGSIDSALKGRDKLSRPGDNKQRVTCFTYGKPGHMSSDCWSKTRTKKEPELSTTQRDVKPIVCFACGEAGHRSIECPKKKDRRPKKETTRRIQLEEKEQKKLEHNELIVTVGKYSFPVTLDTSASVSMVPEEFVSEPNYTGNTVRAKAANAQLMTGKETMVALRTGDLELKRRCVLIPGEQIEWTGALALHIIDELELITQLRQIRTNLTETELMYTLEIGDKGEPKGVLSVNGCSVVDCSVTELEEPCVKLSVEEYEAEVELCWVALPA